MKKLFVIALALMLTLSGCFMTANSSETIELDDSTLTFTKDTVYILYRETITYPDGTEWFTEYDTEDRLPETNFICNGTRFVNGEESDTCYREYDPLGNLIAMKDDSGNERYELNYNDTEQVIKKVTYVDDIETTTEEYTYSGGLLTETTVTQHGQLVKRYVTQFDSNGFRSKNTEYDASGNVVGYTDFVRSESKETAHDYSPEGVLLGYRVNVYSHQDKIVKEECFTPDGILTKTSVWWYVGHSYSYLDIS